MPKCFELEVTDAYVWIESNGPKGVKVSELGKVVATILCRGYRTGIYNVPGVQKANWTDATMIEIKVDGDLSTVDFDRLTRLVIACHEACVRMEISPCNMRFVTLRFHQRSCREGCVSKRHPTIDEAVASFREAYARA